MNKDSVILFDGVCNLCNSSVNFIIDRDKKKLFRFASLQSDAGKELLKKYGSDSENLDSVVIVTNDKLYKKSSAALKIASMLPAPYPLISVFRIIPIYMRDKIYDYIAANRYKWFGKKDSCRMPDADLKSRFLE